tara:strand:- start:17172 stop:17387 length:216 start_codon:yes stop_codon:yes gene_type:complete
MSNWVSVQDGLPECIKLKRYYVKTNTGSFNVIKGESIILGKNTPTGFRFMTSDWETVTHWKEITTQEDVDT